MSPAKITALLDEQLPVAFIAVNPKSCRDLMNRCGIPYLRRFDEIMEAMGEPKAANQDVGLREFVVKHGGRIITVLYARVRADQFQMPKLRMVATSIECSAAETPDGVLEVFLRKLRAAIDERGRDADKTLEDLVGKGIVWDAAA